MVVDSIKSKPDQLYEALEHAWSYPWLTDVILVCDDGTHIRAHRAVVAASSPLLSSLLLQSETEEDTTILLPAISATSLDLILEFVYLGKAPIKLNQMNTLLELAELLKVKGVDAFDVHNEILNQKETFDRQERLEKISNILNDFPQWDTKSKSLKKAAVPPSPKRAKVTPEKRNYVIPKLLNDSIKDWANAEEHSMKHLPLPEEENVNDLVEISKTRMKIKFYCSKCNTFFRNERNLIIHEKTYHKYKNEKNTKLFICGHCEKRFNCKSEMKLHHLSRHAGIKPFKCTECGERFNSRSPLNRHIYKIHEKVTIDSDGEFVKLPVVEGEDATQMGSNK